MAAGVALAACLLWLTGAAPAPAGHGGDADCSDFPTQAAAQQHMNEHPGDPDGLDGNDRDGRACESNPCPCDYGRGAAPAPSPQYAIPERPARSTVRRARIVRVVDGDTLKVRLRSGGRRTVRLIGIDTPETRRPGSPVECGGRQATRRMTSMAFRKKRRRGRRAGHAVRLRTDPTQDRTDRYGRLLAYVDRVSDRRDLGLAMVRSGWATTYVYGGTPFLRFERYARAERRAEAAGRGIWSRCGR
jgi:endonuclease YncB( thermonuclease family)